MKLNQQDRHKIAKRQAKEMLEIIEHGYTTTKRIHPGYQEYEDAKKIKGEINLFKKYHIKQYFGKWQYFFEKGNMIISLIRIRDSPLSTTKTEKWIWEINASDDKRLFTDCNRFQTKKDAIKEVKNLLGE